MIAAKRRRNSAQGGAERRNPGSAVLCGQALKGGGFLRRWYSSLRSCEFALERGIPAVYPGCWGAASVGEVLYVVPGKTACYECFAAFREHVEIPADPRKYTDPDFDDTRAPGQPGLWANILVITGVAFQVILGLLGLRPEVIDHEHTLWLVNVSDYQSELRPLAVTFAKVKRGCAVCDESLVDALTLEG